MHFPRTGYLAMYLLGLVLAGCGGGVEVGKKQPVHKVSGKITFSGGPVANAAVTFAPKAGQEKVPVAIGRTDAEGKYTLTTYDPMDGAAAGDYTVLVTKESTAAAAPPAHDPTNTKPTVDGSAMHAAAGSAGTAAASSALPDRYSKLDQSNLSATVKAGDKNEFNFELTP